MTDATFVYVFDSGNNLLENSDCCFLVKTLVLDDIIEKLTAAAVLHNQIKFRFGFNNLKHSG